jgi:4-amino-4-deoxy-L-arabinose transferase-like glycosyltransferase
MKLPFAPPLVVLFGAALLVRLLFAWYVESAGPLGSVFDDAAEYDAVGWSIANGDGFMLNGAPYAVHPPGYPLFLGVLYAVFGHHEAVVKIVQACLGGLTCVLVWLIGERLFTRRTGMVAASIAAVYPLMVFYTGVLLSETLYVFLATLLLHLLVRLRDTPSLRGVCLAGVVLGLMNLTRPVTLLLPAALLLWGWLEFASLRRAAVTAAVIAGITGLMMAPWVARNDAVLGVTSITTNQWTTLYSANNPAILDDPEAIGGYKHMAAISSEDAKAAYLSFLRDYAAGHPGEFIRLEMHKLKRFWSIFPRTGTAARDGLISLCSYGLLLPWFLVGLGLSVREREKPWVLFLWVGYFTLTTLIVYGSVRYRQPIEPVMILFGSVALERAWRWCRETRPTAPLPVAAPRDLRGSEGSR